MAGTGYRVGPTLAKDETPWPIGWEQDPRIDDGHTHDWETCLLRDPVEEVVRCAICHAPRCGNVHDEDPCMERRHHRCPHLTLTGQIRLVGG